MYIVAYIFIYIKRMEYITSQMKLLMFYHLETTISLLLLLCVGITAKKAMKYERFGNCLTNARQKSRYVFGQNFTDLVYVDRRHSLLTAFVAGSI